MKQIITNDIPKATPDHLPGQVLSWMDDYKISHLPYFVKEEYTMLLTESQLFDYDPMLPIGEQIKNTIFCPFCTENQHVLEIIPVFSKNRLSLLPILSKEKKYLGVIRADDLFFEYGSLFSEFSGAIVKLEMAICDYTLTQISQIVESDGAKILQLFTKTESDSERINITLVLHGSRIQSVIQSFIRYGYVVEEVYGQQSEDPTGMLDRYDSLMNFLNI